MKVLIPRSVELLDRVQTALTLNRLPLLIAVDGMDGVGKSSLASWLAWQTGMPTVHLDLFIASTALVHGLTLVTHNTKDFAHVPGLTLEDWLVP